MKILTVVRAGDGWRRHYRTARYARMPELPSELAAWIAMGLFDTGIAISIVSVIFSSVTSADNWPIDLAALLSQRFASSRITRSTHSCLEWTLSFLYILLQWVRAVFCDITNCFAIPGTSLPCMINRNISVSRAVSP